MNTSSKFIVAIHIMATLAVSRGRPLKSESISWSVNTNAVVIRRIISLLRKAGLVASQKGPEGGSWLAKEPDQISLLDIYEAVEESGLFRFHYAEPNCNCPVGAYMKTSICDVFKEAENAMKNVLRERSLMEVTQEILDLSGISEKLAEGWTIAGLQQNYRFENGRLVKREREPAAA